MVNYSPTTVCMVIFVVHKGVSHSQYGSRVCTNIVYAVVLCEQTPAITAPIWRRIAFFAGNGHRPIDHIDASRSIHIDQILVVFQDGIRADQWNL